MANKNTRNSTTCALESCNNSVRFDNASFPYCSRYHSHLKSDTTKVDRMIDDNPHNMVSINRMLKNAEVDESITSQGIEMANLTFENITNKNDHQTRIRDMVKTALGSCGRHYKKYRLNPFDPHQAAQHRDKILDDVESDLKDKNFTVERIVCEDGSAFINGEQKINDHEALLVKMDDTEVVVDVASAAPLDGIIEGRVDKYFGSGNSTFGDGVTIVDIVEYGRWSSGEYKTIKNITTGEVEWNNKSSTDYGYDDQRKTAKQAEEKYGEILFPPIDYQGFENEKNDDNIEKSQNDTLESRNEHPSDMTREEIRAKIKERELRKKTKANKNVRGE